MSVEEMDRLVRDYPENLRLQNALLAAEGDLGKAAEIARESGYDVTAEEAASYIDALQGTAQAELTDTQLDAVSGGKASPFPAGS